jgi:HEAT repeats
MRYLLQWKLDSEVLLFMKERAVSDENPKVREAAIHWIARGWLGDTDVLPWLKERANDESPDVRQAVLRDVARGWKDEPDTLPWLRERGAQDEHEGVQQVQEEQAGTRPPEVFTCTGKKRAQSAPENGVLEIGVNCTYNVLRFVLP